MSAYYDLLYEGAEKYKETFWSSVDPTLRRMALTRLSDIAHSFGSVACELDEFVEQAENTLEEEDS